MEKSQSEVRQQTPYQVIREYRLSGTKSSGANADVVAQVDFSPRLAKITAFKNGQAAREGSRSCSVSWIMKRKRAKAIKARTALTKDNYDFPLMSDTVLDGRPCYVLGLKPKRKEKDLILGSAWVDKSSFLILHIEGETAKTPSWWLKAFESSFRLAIFPGLAADEHGSRRRRRLLGLHTLRSRILDYRGSDISASIKLAPTRTQSRSQDLAH